jgi:PAS domain S-box-containing protein
MNDGNKKKPARRTQAPSKPAAQSRRTTAETLEKELHQVNELSAADLKKLIHELGTYKLELEMQNDELRRVQAEVGASRAKYADLYEFSPLGYFTFDRRGVVMEVNHTGAAMLGVSKRQLLETPFLPFIAPSDRPAFLDHLAAVFAATTNQTIELELLYGNGAIRHVRLESHAVDALDGNSDFCRTAMSDVTDRHQVEEALRQSENLFRLITERSNEITFQLDLQGRVDYVSPAAARYGFDPKELLGIGFSSLVFPEDLAKASEAFRRAISGEQLNVLELRCLRKDGSSYLAEISVVPIRKEGRIVGLQGLSRDVSERVILEEKLRESEGRLEFALAASHTGAWEMELANHTAFRSLEHDRIFGYTELLPHWTYEMFLDHVLPEDRAEVDNNFRRALECRGDWNFECRIRRVDGGVRWIWAIGRHRRDNSGAYSHLAGIVQDITERKRAEETLKDQELKASALINAATESIWLFNLEGKVLAANNTAARRLGMSAKEVVGRNWQELIPPALAASRKAMVEEVVRSGNPAQFTDERAGIIFDHTVYPVRNSAGELVAVAFFSRDVTERKQDEQERERLTKTLQEQAAELDTVFKALPVIVSLHANDGTYLRVNPALIELFGFDPTHASREEIAGRLHARFPDGQPLTPETMPSSRVLRGESVSGVEYLITAADGRDRALLFNAVPLQREGQVYGMVLAQLDITERKNAEEKLRASEARYRLLADTMLQGVVHQNAAGEIVSMNPAAERILGKTSEEFLGSSSVQEEHDTIRENGERFPGTEHPSMLALRDGQPVRGVIMGVFNPKLGEYRWINIDTVPVFSPGETQPSEVYTVFDDITLRKQAEEALRQNEKKLSDLYNSMSEGLALHEMIYDKSGKAVDYRIVDVNPAFEMITGLQRTLAIGKMASAVYATGEAPYLEVYAEVAATGKATAFEAHFAPMNKHFRISVFSPDKGKFATIFQDITERKQAEIALREAEERERARAEELATVLDAVPVAVWIATDPQGLHITGNKLSYEWLRIPTGTNASKSAPEGLVPETFRMFKDGVEIPPAEMPVQLAAAGAMIHDYEFSFVYPDNSVRNVLGNAAPLFDKNGISRGSVSAFIDITERKEAETKISRLNAQLEHKVTELETANQELEGFTYSVSHDLRAPIRHIAGFAKVLEMKGGNELNDESREYLTQINTAAERLGVLTDALLEFSRMGRKEFGMAKVDLGGLITEVVENLRDRTTCRRIEWRLTKLPMVIGDATMLRFVVENLLNNAVKYTGKREQARIEVGYTEDDSRYIVFVKDNGSGFDMAYYDKLFGVFQRLHSQDEFEGTGIGLANVRRIIHRHGGEVWAESKIDQGATFYFSLPKKLKDKSIG